MFSASPFFPRFIFTIAVVQVPWLPVTEGHVTPFGVSLGVRMRNRKLRYNITLLLKHYFVKKINSNPLMKHLKKTNRVDFACKQLH
jgi:hypothetical protein